MSKAFNLTGEQVMEQLTPEEVKGFNLSLPQMTPAAKRFVYLLAYERIQKAALLAACVKALESFRAIYDKVNESPDDEEEVLMDIMTTTEWWPLEQLRSAIEQAEAGEA